MHTAMLFCIAAAMASVLPLIQAVGASNPKGPLFYTQQICYTRVGTKSVKPIPTSTQSYTLTVPFPVIFKSTATKTITPAPSTTTSVSTTTVESTTTASDVTDTFTVTSTPSTTIYSTNTQTTTITETSTSVTFTTQTSTVTIGATASGYTPVATQLKSQPSVTTYSRKRKVGKFASGNKKFDSNQGGQKYAHNVQCKQIVEKVIYKTITVPAFKTTTITATPSTSTCISTSSVTSTVTVAPPSVSTTVTSTALSTNTITSSTISTSTTTTTTTQIDTATVQAPVETAYTPCQADNMISRINGMGFYLDDTGYPLNNQSNVPSALQCCRNCQQAALLDQTQCRFYFYTQTQICYMATSPNNPQQYRIELAASASGNYIGNAAGGAVML